MDLKSYWKERLSNNFNLSGVGFDRVGERYNHWLYRLRAKFFKRAIKHTVANHSLQRGLDVGTGTGFYLSLLQDLKVTSLTAIDFNQISASTLAQQFPHVSFFEVDITATLPNTLQGAFDLIICMDVLFHITDERLYQKALSNIHALLKSEGTFIMTENLSAVRAERGHIVDRTKSEIYKHLNQAGFFVKHEASIFITMNKPVKSKSKWLWQFSNWRVSLLTQNKAYNREWLNYLIGMLLYFIDVTCHVLTIKGSGTSVLICHKTN